MLLNIYYQNCHRFYKKTKIIVDNIVHIGVAVFICLSTPLSILNLKKFINNRQTDL